jgi:hypothetical protein
MESARRHVSVGCVLSAAPGYSCRQVRVCKSCLGAVDGSLGTQTS